jgi:hypothetical protein
MSLFAAPFGLAPSLHPSGIVRPAISGGPQVYGGINIASGYPTNIFMNSPVQIDAATPSGNMILATALGAAGAGAAANRILGAFQGVEFTMTATGRRAVANYWPANTVGSTIVAWCTREPNIYYEIQANGPVAQTALGAQASITANTTTSGNLITGFSNVALDVTTTGSLTQTSTNQLRIVGFAQRIDNLPGDPFTIVMVQIAMHQDVANQVAY